MQTTNIKNGKGDINKNPVDIKRIQKIYINTSLPLHLQLRLIPLKV